MIISSIKIPASLKLLPHQSALFCLEVEKNILNIIQNIKDLHFLLTLSGGADSTALAFLFYFLAPRHNLKLSICHINHHLRPEAEEDQAFAEELASRLNLPFYLSHLNIEHIARQNNCGIEEAARKGRYFCFEKLRKALNANFILTAHHSGDLAEDVLMRVARGAGWPALGGMQQRTGFILRPLLHFSKKKLTKFLKSFNQPWREDKSNSDLTYTRNRFRHKIIPLFLRENPAFEQNIGELNELARLEKDYWNRQLTEKLTINPWVEKINSSSVTVTLPDRLLIPLHAVERLRIYMQAIKRLGIITGLSPAARARTLLKLDKAYKLKKGGKTFQFPGKIQAKILKGAIIFSLPS